MVFQMSIEPIAKHTIIGEPFAFGREFMGLATALAPGMSIRLYNII
jgi:hypothetical protein